MAIPNGGPDWLRALGWAAAAWLAVEVVAGVLVVLITGGLFLRVLVVGGP